MFTSAALTLLVDHGLDREITTYLTSEEPSSKSRKYGHVDTVFAVQQADIV